LKKKISQLQTYSTNNTVVLPPYDIRRSQEIIETINKEVKAIEILSKPKKKFAFSSRISKPNPINKAVLSETNKPESVVPTSSSSSNSLMSNLIGDGRLIYEKLTNEHIIVSVETIETHLSKLTDGLQSPTVNLLLKDCSHCTIRTQCPSLGAVRLEGLSNCSVLLGPCSTSVYLEGCRHCTVFIACHQLRVHNCSDSDLYVKVQSHPIIEDCSGLGFAPYAFEYEGSEAHLQAADLNAATCWDNVVDFRWHKSSASPNWRVIPDALRVLAADLISLPLPPVAAKEVVAERES